MDIAVVYPRFDSLGGAERFGLELMRRWSGEHDITLYALSIDEGLLEEHDVEVRCVTCETRVPNWRTNTFALMLAVKTMGKQIGKHDRYLLNVFPTHLIDKHPNVWCPQEPARILYDLYPELPQSKSIGYGRKIMMTFYFPVLRLMDRHMNRADRILANSRYSREYLRRVYGVEPEVVYLGADLEGEPRLGGDYVLSVGRLLNWKRVDLAVKAIGDVKDLTLKVAGTGPEGENLKAMAPDNVEFLGRVPQKQLFDLYRNALCTVFTPLREPFGLVALESMTAGTPVIGGLSGGYTEVIDDGVDGFLVEPTPENIAGKIKLLREDRRLSEKMSANARKKAERYSWDKTAAEILAKMGGP